MPVICRVEAKPHTSPHTGARQDGVSMARLAAGSQRCSLTTLKYLKLVRAP